MYSGTFPIPVTRCSVLAVWRVLVSDHSGLPVTARSLISHTSGALNASNTSPASSRRPRGAGTRSGAPAAPLPGPGPLP